MPERPDGALHLLTGRRRRVSSAFPPLEFGKGRGIRPLLSHHCPECRTWPIHDVRIGSDADTKPRAEKPDGEIDLLAGCAGERLVEAADRIEHVVTDSEAGTDRIANSLVPGLERRPLEPA